MSASGPCSARRKWDRTFWNRTRFYFLLVVAPLSTGGLRTEQCSLDVLEFLTKSENLTSYLPVTHSFGGSQKSSLSLLSFWMEAFPRAFQTDKVFEDFWEVSRGGYQNTKQSLGTHSTTVQRNRIQTPNLNFSATISLVF